MSEWQSIETAPQDGTRVLVGRFVKRCFYNKSGHVQVDWFRRPEDKAGFIGWGRFNMHYWPPTHWMPIPEPPK